MRLAGENVKSGKKGKKGDKHKGKPKVRKIGCFPNYETIRKQGAKKGKGKKGDGAAKVKKCCDGENALADQTLQQCIDELVRLGIAQKLPEQVKKVDEFVGDFNYLGTGFVSTDLCYKQS